MLTSDSPCNLSFPKSDMSAAPHVEQLSEVELADPHRQAPPSEGRSTMSTRNEKLALLNNLTSALALGQVFAGIW